MVTRAAKAPARKTARKAASTRSTRRTTTARKPVTRQSFTNSSPSKRAEIEAFLNKFGVEWEFVPAVPLSGFDFEKSLRNQARVFTQLDEQVVSTYAEAMRQGDEFPGVIAHRPSARTSMIIIDGNHRLFARREAGQEATDTYIVTKAKPQTIVQMTFEANARHGLPTSFNERVYQAIYLVDNGMAQEQAATAVQVKFEDLKKAWARVKADRRADEVGINRREWEALSQSSRNRLENVLTDEGFRAATDLSFRANLDANEVFELVAEVNKVRSSSRQVAVVQNYTDAYSERIQNPGGGTSRRTQTPKQALGLIFGRLATLPENIDVLVEQYRIAPADRADTAKRARESATYLKNFADKLEKLS